MTRVCFTHRFLPYKPLFDGVVEIALLSGAGRRLRQQLGRTHRDLQHEPAPLLIRRHVIRPHAFSVVFGLRYDFISHGKALADLLYVLALVGYTSGLLACRGRRWEGWL